MSNEMDFDPLKGYNPADINVEDIKAVNISREQVDVLLASIETEIRSAGTVNEVLAVLSNVGQMTIKLGVQALAEGAIDKLTEM